MPQLDDGFDDRKYYVAGGNVPQELLSVRETQRG
jgi:hypothetical protein